MIFSLISCNGTKDHYSTTEAEKYRTAQHRPDAHQIIRLFPPKSALILTDATNARYNQASAAAIKEFAVQNTPYVKASASVGIEGLRELLRGAIERRVERSINAFETRTEAMDWLVSQ